LHFEWASRDIAEKPGQSAKKYQQALAWARTACQLDPKNGAALFTLGMALYRNGKYQDALETLQRAHELNKQQEPRLFPTHLALLAMTRHQLGQKKQARANLERASTALGKGPAITSLAYPIHREARELIEGKVAGPKK
jgi:tetratricopeptide (TPR) repeat protein